jgi:hypothetical protein
MTVDKYFSVNGPKVTDSLSSPEVVKVTLGFMVFPLKDVKSGYFESSFGVVCPTIHFNFDQSYHKGPPHHSDMVASTPVMHLLAVLTAAEVRQLLADGADIEERGQGSNATSLIAASRLGNEAVVRVLLEHGALTSATTDDGWTPLHYAAFKGREAVVRLLIEHGADASAEDRFGWTPEALANSESYHYIASMIPVEAECKAKAKCVAFAMGQHARQGAGSWVRGLEVGVVQMVLERV